MSKSVELKEQIRLFVVDNFLFGQDSSLADDSSFLESGIIDSTGVLELIAHIEATYELSVADHEMLPENLDSINRLVAYIESKKTAVPA